MNFEVYIESKIKNLYFFPVLHGRVEFAEFLQKALQILKPDAIAVEFPEPLEPDIIEGVKRLPQCSTVLYTDDADNTFHLLIHPADPFVEAIKMSLFFNTPVYFIDAPIAKIELHADHLPDPYVLIHKGMRYYYDTFLKLNIKPDKTDTLRERYMSLKIKELLKKHSSLLVLTGIVHVKGIENFLLKNDTSMPLFKKNIKNPYLFNVHPESLPEILSPFPGLETIFELKWNFFPASPTDEEYFDNDLKVIERKNIKLGLVTGSKKTNPFTEKKNAYSHILPLCRTGEFIDRRKVIYNLLLEAKELYESHTGDKVLPWQWQNLDRFLYKYITYEGSLLPDFYQILASTRACIDDNFAYEVWELFTFYPWQEEYSDLPTIKISGEDLFLGTKKIRLKRQVSKSIRRLKRFPVKVHINVKKGENPFEAERDAENIVSYPPEDIVIENFVNNLKNKALGVLSEELFRVEPFSTHLGDGIDLRETIRNYKEGRIYIKNTLKRKGGADTVVIIFDRDPDDSKFPYRITWLGEHQNESDMAFYSTIPGEKEVGPGIFRCEYGGFMMIFPPMQLYDVWRIPEYFTITTKKHEILLLAAIDYSKERNIIYVDSKPPHPKFKQIAEGLRKKIIYIPLGSLSPEKLKKIRVFHILNGRDKRKIAKKYIW